MERPSCRTCPYWDNSNDEPGREPKGFCRKRSPRFPPTESLVKAAEDSWGGIWPDTYYFEWCGEHPDFPVWLAARKANQKASTSTQ